MISELKSTGSDLPSIEFSILVVFDLRKFWCCWIQGQQEHCGLRGASWSFTSRQGARKFLLQNLEGLTGVQARFGRPRA